MILPHFAMWILSNGPSHCNGRAIYNARATPGATNRWGDKIYDPNQLWIFDIYPIQGKEYYKIKNLGSGLYLSINKYDEVISDDKPYLFEVISLIKEDSFQILDQNGRAVYAISSAHFLIMLNKTKFRDAGTWNIVAATPDELQKVKESIDHDKTYKLVWSEEFSVDGKVDNKRWSNEIGFLRNQEDQWYQPENSWVENGNLVIEARKETKLNPNYKEGSSHWERNRKWINYTSASITTNGLLEWTYGRFDFYAKIPRSGGAWPAFWFQ